MTTEVTSTHRPSEIIDNKLQIVAWEITRSCNLSCAHCRASAHREAYEGELSTAECFRVVDEIVEVGKPMLIVTGGEPLMRPDALEIASYASRKGLRVVMGTNGTTINKEMAAKLKAAPIAAVGISLDFPFAEKQDQFRGLQGAFDTAMTGIRYVREEGIAVQVNSTISKLNVAYKDDLLALAMKIGATAFSPFLLIPTGRGKNLESSELSPEEYERTLNWIYEKQQELQGKISIRPTCAPHFQRVTMQRRKESGMPVMPPASHAQMSRPMVPGERPSHAVTRGCMSGTGFAFISHVGRVQGCGYLDLEAGNVKKASFGEIWNNSKLFNEMRNLSNITGKCGVCEYRKICGGCRARAFETCGDHLASEPYCIYEPVAARRNV